MALQKKKLQPIKRDKIDTKELLKKSKEWAESEKPQQIEQQVKISVQLPKSKHKLFKTKCLDESLSMQQKLSELILKDLDT